MTNEQIKKRLKHGDYQIAAQILNISVDNARVRFARRKQDIKEVLIAIIANRDTLIKSIKEKNT